MIHNQTTATRQNARNMANSEEYQRAQACKPRCPASSAVASLFLTFSHRQSCIIAILMTTKRTATAQWLLQLVQSSKTLLPRFSRHFHRESGSHQSVSSKLGTYGSRSGTAVCIRELRMVLYSRLEHIRVEGHQTNLLDMSSSPDCILTVLDQAR